MAETVYTRLERKIDELLRVLKPKKLWVRVSVITELTGWNNEKMRQARDNGYIEYEERTKNDKRQFWYNLNSLNEKFIRPS